MINGDAVRFATENLVEIKDGTFVPFGPYDNRLKGSLIELTTDRSLSIRSDLMTPVRVKLQSRVAGDESPNFWYGLAVSTALSLLKGVLLAQVFKTL